MSYTRPPSPLNEARILGVMPDYQTVRDTTRYVAPLTTSQKRKMLFRAFHQSLPAGFVSDVGLDGQSREEDPDGGANQSVQGEGGQYGQNGVGAHGLEEA